MLGQGNNGIYNNTFGQEEVYVTKETAAKRSKREIFRNILKILMGGVALADVILLAGLVFNLLTYEKMGYLFIGLAVMIILAIVYMATDEEESPDMIMEDYNRVSDSLTDQENELKESDIYRKPEEDCFYGETVLLTADKINDQTVEELKHGSLYLESMLNEKLVPIRMNKDSIVIGCMREGCDYVLSERGISRFHAKLMKKGDGLFLLDLNSTNGTFINGEQTEPGKDYKLASGDMVSFAGNGFLVVEDLSHTNSRKAC
jgi:hypothetical protein